MGNDIPFLAIEAHTQITSLLNFEHPFICMSFPPFPLFCTGEILPHLKELGNREKLVVWNTQFNHPSLAACVCAGWKREVPAVNNFVYTNFFFFLNPLPYYFSYAIILARCIFD